jgi:3-hydroxypropanoate dehydrogenase
MTSALNGQSLDQMFRSARTPNGWADRPVEDDTGREICDLMKWGPTSANCSPARSVWVRSTGRKATLAGLAAEPNKPKILKAPVTVIIGHDLDFASELPKRLPHNAEVMQKYFAAPGVAEVTAMRNGTLQGAYLIVAARALGLDCGPMSGFDTAAFNLNLLERMNRELGANFQRDGFRHEARWNPDECAVEMHIVCLCPQIVTAGFFDFWTGDSIHTESSRKYDAQSFTRLAELGGWDVAELWTDADRLFAVFGLVAAERAQGC